LFFYSIESYQTVLREKRWSGLSN